MINIKPEDFTKIGSEPIYTTHLQYIDEFHPERALKIAKQVGGIQSTIKGGEYFVEFATDDLRTLCTDIEKIANGECDEKD